MTRRLRTRARLAELLMEISSRAHHQGSIDAIRDRTARARWHFVRRIWDSLREVTGVGHLLQLVSALIARLKREDALDAIEDADREAILAAAFEASGLVEELEVAASA